MKEDRIMTATKTYVIESATDDPQALLRDLTALEMRANALGLFPAARAMNNAKNAIGWQIAGDIAQADAASTRRE
jgi:hypothetical protein